MLQFLWFKKGKFINPKNKINVVKQYIKEEIDNFYNKNIFNIPQVEFCITTKCTLKCKDCCALIPQLDKEKPSQMSFVEFKKCFEKLIESVNYIHHLVILGGEPLLNKDLAAILDYAASKDSVYLIQLVTNGTMHFNQNLIDVLKKNKEKIYVYISNYAKNLDLSPLLKHDEIKEILRENDIKLQKREDEWFWLKECGFANEMMSGILTKEKMLNCYRSKCNSILNGKFDICSKATAAREMNIFKISDSVDINNSKNLRQDLINFYKKDYSDACKYCILSNEEVQPAIQLK